MASGPTKGRDNGPLAVESPSGVRMSIGFVEIMELNIKWGRRSLAYLEGLRGRAPALGEGFPSLESFCSRGRERGELERGSGSWRGLFYVLGVVGPTGPDLNGLNNSV